MGRRIKQIAISLALLAALGAGGVVFANWYVQYVGQKDMVSVDDAQVADCLIVPGAMTVGDSVSADLAKRLDTALVLYQLGKAKKIIVSGDHGTNQYNEVKAMRKYLAQRGVNVEDIFMDHAGFSTYDTMYRVRDVFVAKSAIVVTQRQQAVRALYIARKLKLPCQGVAAADYDSVGFQEKREFLARVKAFLQCAILHSKPAFLGDTIPVSGSGLLTEDGK